MKISVIMVDGSFRENIFGAEYFTNQDFPKEDYEVIWVEFYQKANPGLEQYTANGLRVITLGNDAGVTYHSSYCFNEGIKQAQGEILVIPDADQIIEPDFLSKVYERHQQNDRLVVYGHRLDEEEEGMLTSTAFNELKKTCKLRNLHNRGGCLTVRKKWLMEINGYEQHYYFQTGFHANGADIYYRLLNHGLSIAWDKELRLYHPWHPHTLAFPKEKKHYQLQFKLLNWRAANFVSLPFEGIDPEKNCRLKFPFDKEPEVTIRQPTVVDNNVPSIPVRVINKLKRLLS